VFSPATHKSSWLPLKSRSGSPVSAETEAVVCANKQRNPAKTLRTALGSFTFSSVPEGKEGEKKKNPQL